MLQYVVIIILPCTNFGFDKLCLHLHAENHTHPLTPSGDSCYDLAEIFNLTLFNYYKNILFYALFFLARTVKKLLTILYFYFWKFLQSKILKMFHVSI